MAELVTYLPISSPFIRFAGRYVDEAFGVAAGYNFFVFEAALVPFEIVACNVIIHYWSDVIPAGGVIAIIICLYGYVNASFGYCGEERKPVKGNRGGDINLGLRIVETKTGQDSLLTPVNVWQSHQHLRGEMVWGVRVLAGPGQGGADHRLDRVHVRFILFPISAASMSPLFTPGFFFSFLKRRPESTNRIAMWLSHSFITMLGGNPQHDRFGFRFWRDPGSFAPLYKTGATGRFLGFLQCLILASFTIAGPDYVSMAAGEAENPRVVMPRAYNKVFGRLMAFFVLGSLAVGINVPYNDKELTDAYSTGAPGAAASPYVVAMNRLGITVMPDIVNALVLSASFSAGNSYVYCASRSLFGLALEGKAPKIFTRCTRNGVPIYCVALVLLISLLSFLQVSNSSAVVLSWFVNLVGRKQEGGDCRFDGEVRADGVRAGDSVAADQFHRYVIHLHMLQECM